MNLKEVYEKTGGDLTDVMSRLMTEERVLKFVRRFPEDPSFEELKAALDAGDKDTAFRGAHTIKGVAQNLGFTGLYEAANNLTEALRPGKDEKPQAEIPALFMRFCGEYEKVISAIAELG